jgi:hypothetical protein
MSKEDGDKMTSAELTAAILRTSVAIAESNGYIRARVDAARERLLADPLLAEGLRALAWHKAGNRNVQVDAAGRLVGVPATWPDGVDGEVTVREHVEAELSPLLAGFGERATEQPAPPSAGVQTFRKLVNE